MINVNAPELKKALDIIKNVHGKYNKEIVPLTIETVGNKEQITLLFGNGSIWAEISLDCMVGDDMSVTVDFKEVYNMVKGAKGVLEIWKNGDQVVLKAGGLQKKISLLEVEPKDSFLIPQKDVKDRHSLTLSGSVLKQGIDNTELSVATDVTKMVLCKLNLKLTEDSVKFASTDGHRLSVCDAKIISREGNWLLTSSAKDISVADQLNIPNPVLKVITKALKEKELKTSEVNIKVNTSNIYYYDLFVELGSRLTITATKLYLDEKFPRYEMLIPKADRHIMTRTFLVKPVLEFLKLVKSDKKVSFKIDFESITFETTDRPDAEKVNLTIPLSPGDSHPECIKFNPRYLLDVLASPNMGNNISLTISKDTPLLFTSDHSLFLIMPIA